MALIIVRIWEGLGNQMFQYAFARALQRQTRNQVWLEGRRAYRNYLPGEDFLVERSCSIQKFNIQIPFLDIEKTKRWDYLKRENVIQKCIYDLNKIHIGKNLFINEGTNLYGYSACRYRAGNFYLMGHYQNLNYFQEIREIILQEFQLKKEKKLPAELQQILDKRETVSVHIRRGDYLLHPDLSRAVKRIYAEKYYDKAMAYINERKKNPVFLFFSDDIEWVKDKIACPFEHYYISEMNLKDYEELMIMKECKNNITANSTFSFWGAWLNQNENRIVTIPRGMPASLIEKSWIIM